MGKVGFPVTSHKSCFQYLSVRHPRTEPDGIGWSRASLVLIKSGLKPVSNCKHHTKALFYVQTHSRSPDLMLLSSGLTFVQVGHIFRNSQECPITTHSLFAPLIPVSAGITNYFLQKMLTGMKSLSCKLC